MTMLGDCVLRWTFADIAQWQGKSFSINLSPVQIMARGFIENLQAQIDAHAAPKAQLEAAFAALGSADGGPG